MSQAKNGDRVKLRFTGRLDDGTVFASSDDCHDDDCGCEAGPLEFVLGEGDIFPAVEQAVVGMALGETRTVRLKAADAYGERDEDMVFAMSRADLPEGLDPEEGEMLELAGDEGEDEGMPVWVSAVDGDSVTLDANHPLAGNDLTFELELLEINTSH